MLVVGDSLSAEYGLPRGTGWVALLDRKLAEEKVAARVVNASISGDTTSGGRSRLPALLAQHQPAVVVIELGGNDALRGLPLQLTVDNLNAMTQAAQRAGAKVLLVGTVTVTGTPTEGSTLVARPGSWTKKAKLSYQWFRGDQPIEGANKATYKIQDVDGGSTLSVVVTGTKQGFNPATTKSKATTAVPTVPFSATAKPKITGTAREGPAC